MKYKTMLFSMLMFFTQSWAMQRKAAVASLAGLRTLAPKAACARAANVPTIQKAMYTESDLLSIQKASNRRRRNRAIEKADNNLRTSKAARTERAKYHFVRSNVYHTRYGTIEGIQGAVIEHLIKKEIKSADDWQIGLRTIGVLSGAAALGFAGQGYLFIGAIELACATLSFSSAKDIGLEKDEKIETLKSLLSNLEDIERSEKEEPSLDELD